jgi:hypothetical protein
MALFVTCLPPHRYGASILESVPEELQCLSLQQYLEFLVGTFNNPLVHPKTQDSVLQAIGMVCIARPEVLVFNRDVTDILRRMLQPGADMTLKQRALSNLIDLLKVSCGHISACWSAECMLLPCFCGSTVVF